MPRFAVLRILARLEDAWRADKTYYLFRRRPSLSRPKAPDRSIGSDDWLVRQVFAVASLPVPSGCSFLGLPNDLTVFRCIVTASCKKHGKSWRYPWFWFHQSSPSPARVPILWMKTLRWPYSSAPLNTTVFIHIGSHWIVSATARRKQPALIFSSSSAKITTPNAAETPKPVR